MTMQEQLDALKAEIAELRAQLTLHTARLGPRRETPKELEERIAAMSKRLRSHFREYVHD